MLPASLPVLSSQEKVILLQEMMAEVDCLLHETDNFWQDPENISSYLYQAWGGLVLIEICSRKSNFQRKQTCNS